MNINQIRDSVLNVYCRKSKVKTHLQSDSLGHGCSSHKANLCTLKGLMRQTKTTFPYKKPSKTSVDPPILVLKELFFAMQ